MRIILPILFLLTAAFAQTPNPASTFVGIWVLDQPLAETGPRPPFGAEFEIRLEGRALIVSQDGAAAAYDLTGKPTTTVHSAFGFESLVTTGARWTGPSLILTRKTAIRDSVIESITMLSRDGRRLRVSEVATGGRGTVRRDGMYRRKAVTDAD